MFWLEKIGKIKLHHHKTFWNRLKNILSFNPKKLSGEEWVEIKERENDQSKK